MKASCVLDETIKFSMRRSKTQWVSGDLLMARIKFMKWRPSGGKNEVRKIGDDFLHLELFLTKRNRKPSILLMVLIL